LSDKGDGKVLYHARRYDIWIQISVEELEEKYNFKTKALVGG
jgi:hypothetical protein